VKGVLFVLHNYDHAGGMEGQARRLADRIAARGVPVTVATTFFPSRRPDLRRHEWRGGVEIARVPCFTWWTGEAVDRFFEASIAHVLARRRRAIDVVYAVHYGSGCHAVEPAHALGVPVVVKFACGGHDGDLAHLARQDARSELARRLARVDRFVCLSTQIRDEARALGIPDQRLVAIANGIDPAFADDAPPAALPELGDPSGRRVILFVGRLDHQKRASVLLRAFARVHERVPEARLALAGAGPLRAELEQLARALGLADRTAFLGSRADVASLHRASRAFVLPSASEGIPNALLEALAAGTPSVATDVPGTHDVARHEREALLVPVDDEAALAAALVRVLEDEALAARLVAAGKARVQEEYALERVVDRYLATFAELAAHPPAPEGSLVSTHARFVSALARGLARSAVARLRGARA
jgi:glycosyltransferase involved in cell wall biosynthesis